MNSVQSNIVGTGEVRLGRRTVVAPDVQFVFSKPAKVSIGDYCTIGPGVKFVCDGGDVRVDDWTTIHDRSLVLSSAGVDIGQHCWFGQHCVLDGTGGLRVGNGVRVGMYSQIWSHVAAGERIEGCTLFGVRPVTIEDDVWLVGSCIVSSGVTIGRRTVALINSNVTKSWPAESVLAGSPAQLKPGLAFYQPISTEEKWKLLCEWLIEISATLGAVIVEQSEDVFALQSSAAGIVETVRFERGPIVHHAVEEADGRITICSLSDKRYTKQLTDLEHRVLKALSSNKARFLAHRNPADPQIGPKS